MPDTAEPDSAIVCFRRSTEGSEDVRPWSRADVESLSSASPREGLDSWLEALSRRLLTPPRDLFPALGLTRPHQRGLLPAFTVCLHNDEATRAAAATGVSPDRLRAMTLAHYDGTALVVDRENRRINLARLWGRGRGSRFCPACLDDNGGRWLLRWRLGWSFACTRHHCLLADSCPACGRVPRRDTLWLDVPHASRCSEHPGPTAGRALVRCHADLTTAPVLPLPHGHPALRAQELINDCIDQNAATFGVYAPNPVAVSTMLRDLQLLSRAVLHQARERDLVEFAPADLLTAFQAALARPSGYLQPQSLGNDPGRTCPPQAVFTALAATVGITILTQPDIAAAAAALTALNPPDSSPDLAMRQHTAAGTDTDQGIVTTRN